MTDWLKNWLGLLVVALALTACSGGAPPGGGDEQVGAAHFLVREVPAGVYCLVVVARGARTETQHFDLVPGEAASLRFGGLPLGNNVFTGRAYNEACADVTADDTPSYVSDDVAATIELGVVSEVRLFLKQNGQGTLIATFEPEEQCTENAALSASVAESDVGWGGGANPQEINDGISCYPEWWHGLAFTGGTRGWAGAACGWRQVTLDYGGTERTLLSPVTVHHHGADHSPENVRIEVLQNGQWREIFATDQGKSLMQPDSCPVGSIPVDYDIGAPVRATKLRYWLNNCGMPGDGHGWLWEVTTPALCE
jgi:hypothetical protein